LEDRRIDGRIILKWILEKWDAQGSDRWRAFVNAVKKTFGFHKMRGNSWVAEDILASQEGLCSMELEVIFLNTIHEVHLFITKAYQMKSLCAHIHG
jgi:hypothetical protein